MTKQSKYIGLTDREVVDSRNSHGVNILTPPVKTPLWKLFLNKFSDPLIIILLIAGVASVGISFYEFIGLNQSANVFFEPVGIFAAVSLATGLAFFFEIKAAKEFDILNKVNDDEPVTVYRNGTPTEIPRRDIVVGDIVVLTTGQEIPADGELIETVSMSVDESTLTGEPICLKSADSTQFDPDATFPTNHILRGTKVMEGHGVMKVYAVGDSTENGKVFEAVQIDDGVETPLDEQLDKLGKLIARIAYGIAAAVVAGRLIMFFTNSAHVDFIGITTYLLQTIMIAVALIAVAVPEGLPMAITLSLAYSMRRMLRTNNLVRKMHACETMGATTVICTDKTGTLTHNRMTVAHTDFFVPESEMTLVFEGMAVNSTAMLEKNDDGTVRVLGNPTEGALLIWLEYQGLDYNRLRDNAIKTAELPFSTERKYMATVAQSADGRKILYVKGAPEIVFDLCDDTSGLSKSEIDARLRVYQDKAMRTLGFAYAILENGQSGIESNYLCTTNLKFAGITAISDPVREDVPEAVKSVTSAGIKIKIVTGDTPATAKEIGRQIGLWHDTTDSDKNIATGAEIAAMTDEELNAQAEDFKIIARARPMDKKRLVDALRHNGEVVAVTGDGTNDAPALKAAHVGLSMGDGTAVAKEASDITIIDNSFSSISRAVMWGRSLYLNIRRFIIFQMTVNVAACLIVLCGSFMGLQSPLTVTQMLWVNLIMDTFAAMALASLPPSDKVMQEAPRAKNAYIINSKMRNFILGTGGLFSIILLALLYYLDHTDITSLTQIGRVSLGDNTGLSPYELSLFFTFFVFLQFWNMFNAKAFNSGTSALKLKDCNGFILIALIIFLGQIAIVTTGGKFFNVVPLHFTDWIIIIALTSPVLWIGEIIRAIKR